MADKYNLKIPQDLADFFQKYINDHPELGYTFVSQYLLHVLREKAEEIMLSQKDKKIKLEEGTYSKKDLKKLLEKTD
jgi:hypothetical protein